MKDMMFDFNNMFSFNVGARHGVGEDELSRMLSSNEKSYRHVLSLIKNQKNRIHCGLEWAQLPLMDKKLIKKIQNIGLDISKQYENVIFLGIGGSYLGLKAAQDALAQPYYNDISHVLKKSPRIYFEGNNLDPETLSVLVKNLNPKKTFIVVISKSGETIETKAGFLVVENWLKQAIGKRYGRQVFAITDPESGSLREKVDEENKKDILSFQSLPLLKGVGGRFSEFNMGLLHLAIIGVDIEEVLAGAGKMRDICASLSYKKNPSYMYAALQTILYRKKGKGIAVMMPFSEMLKSTADWYVQLLAESLGKKYARKISIAPSGIELWQDDKSRVINTGRTPVSSRGTNDLHSIQQNNIEGENNKTITFMRVEKFKHDIRLPAEAGILKNSCYSELLKLAHEATEWALTRENRPNCTIILPEVTAYYWGALLFFFEMATAFEGELLNVNAFNQPGVESYKNYMYYKLRKPGISKETAAEIKNHPVIRQKKFIY